MARYMAPDSTFSASERQRERERELERRYHARGGYDRGLGGGFGLENSQMALYSPPDPFQNSTISIAPYQAYGNPHSNRGQVMSRERERESNVIEEPVVEHEHHHVHHHIDHGMITFFFDNKNIYHGDHQKCWIRY